MIQVFINIFLLIICTCLLVAGVLQWKMWMNQVKMNVSQMKYNKAMKDNMLEVLKICKEISALHQNEQK